MNNTSQSKKSFTKSSKVDLKASAKFDLATENNNDVLENTSRSRKDTIPSSLLGSTRSLTIKDKEADSKATSQVLSQSKMLSSKELNFDEDYSEIEDHDTLSRGDPISEFLRLQKGNIKGLTQEEFISKYEDYIKDKGINSKNADNNDSNPLSNFLRCNDSNFLQEANKDSVVHGSSRESEGHEDSERRKRSYYIESSTSKTIVLKITTLAESSQESPSFTVNQDGAIVGRDTSNSICIPSDERLAHLGHAFIEYNNGTFYLVDGGFLYAPAIRIGVNVFNKKWYLDKNARFSIGNSIFQSLGIDDNGNLQLCCLEGPLINVTLTIKKEGATFGRSSESTFCIKDKELSRKHSKIEYDSQSGRYFITDMTSTNGTYIQFVGPYGGKYKLQLNDHILIGRTGFSVNRYDYGLSEEMGYRQNMEDACTIKQHLNIGPLCLRDLYPQSYFGVYDGHGGSEASTYLSHNLHNNILHGLLSIQDEIFQIIDRVAPNSIFSDPQIVKDMDEIVIQSLKTSFLETDNNFIKNSPHPQHGSTATTALILGERLYCGNVGDSRTMLCRNFKPIMMSEDHKPTRDDENKRIRNAGGFVINNRVMGELAVSRAFGDVDFKKGIQSILEEEGGEIANVDGEGQAVDNAMWDQPLIIAEPDVEVITLKEDDQFLLLGCDGLFDVYTPEEIVAFVREAMETHGDTQLCCQSLTHDAIRKRNSRDNVSVILIILSKWY